MRIGDLGSLTINPSDSATVSPSILEDDGGSRVGFSQSVVGPDQPERHIVVRVPFADERAEQILATEAKQLPKNESALVMVDVTRQQTAFVSWPKLVPHRFTPRQHTRVGGVLLFATSTWVTQHGPMWLPSLKLIPNPHAKISLPVWITEVVKEIDALSANAKARGLGRNE